MTLVAVVLYRVPTAPGMILKWGGWRLWYLATPGANERLRPPSLGAHLIMWDFDRFSVFFY